MDVRNDEPIDSVVNDLFGFSFQASVIAKLVGGEKSQDHLSVGVSGSWGSGKTSLLNMVKELLDYKPRAKRFNELSQYRMSRKYHLQRNKEIVDNEYEQLLCFLEAIQKKCSNDIPSIIDENKVIWFDPWFFGSQETVIKAFFYRISKELMDEDKELAKLFLKLAVVMSSSPELPDSLPVVGNAFKLINYGQKLFSWMSGDDGSVQDFSDLKRMICDRLKKQEYSYIDDDDELITKPRKRIVIIIDDLDRLQKDEALTMLKVIRLVTEFGINFVIGYDEETLSATIDKNCGGHGREYIRKMINLPIYLSIPTSEMISNYQKEQLSIFQSKYPITFDSKDNFYDFWEINLELVKTIRQVRRITNTFNAFFPLFKEEMDGNIFLGVLLLYEYFPDLFYSFINLKPPFCLDNNSICFIKVHNNEKLTNNNQQAFDEIFKNKSDKKPLAIRLCELLFDIMKQRSIIFIKGNTYKPLTWYDSWTIYLSFNKCNNQNNVNSEDKPT